MSEKKTDSENKLAEEKVIVVDWMIFLHRAVYSSAPNPDGYPPYTCMTMILGCLKKIGVDPDDIVIVAVDSRGSWRKEFEDAYKGDRAQKRKESPIDWNRWYAKFDELIEQLKEATNWHFVKIDHVEADDIMAVACRYFSNHEVILLTYDHDLEQMWVYDNVKIFSPMTKRYKLKPKNFNVYSVLSKMIKQETSDNLTSPVLTAEDYDIRLKCVTLLELPDWVESEVIDKFESMADKSEYVEKMPFAIVRERFGSLYNDKKNVITYEDCVAKEERKKKRAKKRKQRSKETQTK